MRRTAVARGSLDACNAGGDPVAEGLSAAEVGKEIAEHHHEHTDRHEILAIAEAVMLSIVALLAAWSGYSAAKWSTEASLDIARASATRTKSNLANVEAIQLRTLDNVTFNAALTAYESGNQRLFRLTVKRLRPGYRPAFEAWLALHPLKNRAAPADPSDLPQYRIPQEAQAARLGQRADTYFTEGVAAAGTADEYVRLTVLLAAVLFLVGISSHFPLRKARWGLVSVGFVLLVIAAVQVLSLPGPPG
jgi:hypothetical protein